MITLLHPSRGRPEMAFNTFQAWKRKAVNDFEYILGLDESDKSQDRYKELYTDSGVRAFIGNNNSVVECTNKIAKFATGDILIYLSDDFDCPIAWDELIVNAVKDKDLFMLKVDDCVQPFEQKVLTIPIMSKSLYNKLGYFWNPLYKSMWCDVDLFHETKDYHIYAPELKFRHNHWVAHGQIDKTYKDSESNFYTGKRVFEQRNKYYEWNFQF